MSIFLLQIIEQSLLYFPLILGVYLSFFVLKIPDLSLDGTFVLGAAIYARSLELGFPVLIAIIFAMIGGMISGGFLALVQRKNRINPIIASIILLFILHSVNLIIMNRPNISLFGFSNLLSMVTSDVAKIFALTGIVLLLAFLFIALMSSQLGLYFKAYGNNKNLFSTLGYSSEKTRVIGLALSQSLFALSGAFMAQNLGFADITMGVGQVLVAITLLLLGLQLLSFSKFFMAKVSGIMLFSFLGACIYFAVLSFLISFGVNPQYLKMIIGMSLLAILFTSKSNFASQIGLGS